MANNSFRIRLARTILGSHVKDFIPALNPVEGVDFGGAGRLNDYASKPGQLSANLGWCFAANNAIADPTSAVQLQLFQKKPDGDREQITDHPILDLLDAPNFIHTGEQLRHLHFTYMNYVGESYIYMRDGDGSFIPAKGKLPDALDIFPAHQVQFILGQNYTSSTVKMGSNDYPITAFIRDLNPDPENPYQGRSIIKAAAMAIDTDEQMKAWNRNVFANNARPSLIFSSNEPMDDDVYERWKKQFIDEHTGTENAYKPLLIEGGSASPYMLSQTDLDFLESRKFSMTEILSMWRVSPGMLGQIESTTRSNLDAAFYINAMLNVVPRIRQFVKQLNVSLVKVYDPTLELDFLNPVPEDVAAKLAAATAGVDKWFTKDEVRNMYGEKPLPDGLGEQLYMLNTNAPLSSIADGTARPAPATTPPVADPDDSTKSLSGVKKKDLTPAELEEARKREGNAKKTRSDQMATQLEQQMVAACSAQFNAQRVQILANLNTARIGTKSYTRKDWLNDLLDWLGATDNLAAAIKPIIHTTLIQAGQAASQQVGLEPSMFNPFTQPLIDYFQNRSTKVAKDVNDETSKQLRASLSQGVQDGESQDQLRARVEDVMGSASSMRADRIARTEVTRAQGYADIQAWKQSGVVSGKEWFTAEDEHVCPFCDSLDRQTYDLDENIFTQGESLTVGDQTQHYNYDDVPSPPLHVNCRCVLLPIRD